MEQYKPLPETQADIATQHWNFSCHYCELNNLPLFTNYPVSGIAKAHSIPEANHWPQSMNQSIIIHLIISPPSKIGNQVHFLKFCLLREFSFTVVLQECPERGCSGTAVHSGGAHA